MKSSGGDLTTAIRARVERLVDDLVTGIVDRVEGVIGDALEVARSAVESELAQTGRSSGLDVRETTSSDDRGSRRAEEVTAATAPTHPESSRSRAPSSGTSSTRTNTCRNCGAIGFTARTCGKTHNISIATAPGTASRRPTRDLDEEVGPEAPSRSASVEEDDDIDEKNESPPPVTRAPSDRFAAIEASARKRTGELPVPRSTFRTD